MNLKLEALLLFFGGIIRLLDVGSDIWYLIQVKYKTKLLWYMSLCSLIAPSTLLLLYYSLILMKDLKSGSLTSTKLQIALLFILGDSLGLNYFFFSITIFSSSILSGDFFMIDSLFRATALLNSLFQSLPQIAFQAYNNELLGSWDPFTLTTISISVFSLLYNIFKLVFALDKVQQFEKVVQKVNQTDSRSTNKIIPVQTENNEEEVYESI